MKILIVSDTHRKDDNLQYVIEKEAPFDKLIHLGDIEGSEYVIQQWVPEESELLMVIGNNDFFSDLDKEKEIVIGPHRILLTHGHYYNVTLGVEGLRKEAEERGCDIAMYGHTHRPYLDTKDGITVLNPGSLSYPRQEGRKPTYMIMTVEADDTITYQTVYLG